jgi:hypothetical protein
VLLDTPPALATTMGRYEPARFVGMRNGAYMLPAHLLDSLATFARIHDVMLVDERNTTTHNDRGRVVGPARPLPECANCHQPAKRGHQPAHCAACGHPWQPIEHQPYTGNDASDQCTRCLATQTPGFAYCQNCGTPLQQPNHAPSPPLTVVTRAHLDEPLPIGAVADELLQQQIQ